LLADGERIGGSVIVWQSGKRTTCCVRIRRGRDYEEWRIRKGAYRETGAQAWARRGSKRSENGADGCVKR